MDKTNKKKLLVKDIIACTVCSDATLASLQVPEEARATTKREIQEYVTHNIDLAALDSTVLFDHYMYLSGHGSEKSDEVNNLFAAFFNEHMNPIYLIIALSILSTP